MSTYLKSRNGEQTLWDYVAAARHQIEPALLHLPVVPAGIYKPFNAAMHYALFPGGKRLLPVLTMLGAEVVGGNAYDVLTAATLTCPHRSGSPELLMIQLSVITPACYNERHGSIDLTR